MTCSFLHMLIKHWIGSILRAIRKIVQPQNGRDELELQGPTNLQLYFEKRGETTDTLPKRNTTETNLHKGPNENGPATGEGNTTCPYAESCSLEP